MSQNEKTLMAELISDLKQQRDQIRVRIHLGNMELKDEFEKLDERLNHLNLRFGPIKDAIGETTENVWDSLKLVGSEVGNGFRRILKAL